jgi:hypothetical protein
LWVGGDACVRINGDRYLTAKLKFFYVSFPL